MKHPNFSTSVRRRAFTLIELLVVIAVIGILAALLFPVMHGVFARRAIAVARAELGKLNLAIEAYHAKKNFYPPDNPANSLASPLYFELVGTVLSNGVYVTTDGSGIIAAAQVPPTLGVNGFVNSSASRRGTDDAPGPTAFLSEIRPTQIRSNGAARILVCSEGSVSWGYNSSHPTNNPSSFDLWVDLPVRGKTNRISNWSKEPQVL